MQRWYISWKGGFKLLFSASRSQHVCRPRRFLCLLVLCTLSFITTIAVLGNQALLRSLCTSDLFTLSKYISYWQRDPKSRPNSPSKASSFFPLEIPEVKRDTAFCFRPLFQSHVRYFVFKRRLGGRWWADGGGEWRMGPLAESWGGEASRIRLNLCLFVNLRRYHFLSDRWMKQKDQ